MGDTEEDTPDPSTAKDWDLELIWKRTRLRCMVYSSLGDLEEEDEDYYMEKELLNPRQEDQSSDVVSSAVSIFLTSIIEYLGEQALIIAGQAAFQRIRVKYEKELKEGLRQPGSPTEQIVVQELDMERVALDRTLGRLWRTWKKKIRSPPVITNLDRSLSHSFSRDSMRSSRATPTHATPTHLRSPSVTETPVTPLPETIPEPTNETEPMADVTETETKEIAKEAEVEEYLIAAAIPLPMGENDVAEIEGVGLSVRSRSRDGAEERAARKRKVRPQSLMVWPVAKPANPPTPTLSPSQAPLSASKKRSNSLPTPTATPSGSPTRTKPQESELAPPSTVGEKDVEQAQTSDDKSTDIGGAKVTVAETSVADVPASAQDVKKEAQTRNHGNAESDDEAKISDESEYDDESMDEEPQILTSSRISISGRSASPTVSEHGRPTPIITTMGRTRTPSIYSARLIEVTSPRSPGTAARNSPILDGEHMRLSRSSSLRTASIAEERARYSPDSASGARISGHGGNRSALSAEVAPEDVSPVTDDGGLEAIPEPPSPEGFEGQDMPRGSNPILGSVAERGSPGSSPIRSTPKIATPTSSSGTFYFEDRPKPPPKHHAQHRPRVSVITEVAAPEMPDRSPSRRAPSNLSVDDQPASIGKISVQRSRGRSPSETGSLPRFPEPPKPGVMVRQETASSVSSSSTSTRSSNKLRLVRTSEEGSAAAQSREDVARNFEELIQSDQTIQFTLTPESMRDIDVSWISLI